jgi:NTE family protein
MLLVRPRVSHFGWFAFGHTRELIDEGYRAMTDALRNLDELLTAHGGIHPRRPVRVRVVREKCTGCGLCVAMAPRTMALDGAGKAYALTNEFSWSPADGDFVRHCPTEAIEVDELASRVLPILTEASESPQVDVPPIDAPVVLPAGAIGAPETAQGATQEPSSEQPAA